MINSTLDSLPPPRARWLRQALAVAPAALAIVVSAGIPAVRAAEKYTPSVARAPLLRVRRI